MGLQRCFAIDEILISRAELGFASKGLPPWRICTEFSVSIFCSPHSGFSQLPALLCRPPAETFQSWSQWVLQSSGGLLSEQLHLRRVPLPIAAGAAHRPLWLTGQSLQTHQHPAWWALTTFTCRAQSEAHHSFTVYSSENRQEYMLLTHTRGNKSVSNILTSG